MNKKLQQIVLLLLTLLIISCGGNDKVEIIDIYPEQQMETLSDSSYISMVVDIYRHKNNILLSDRANGRVIFMDNNLNVIKTVGKPGKGPGELLAAGYIQINKDTLYVTDQMQDKISVFYKDKFVRYIRFPSTPLKNFIIHRDKYIIYSNPFVGKQNLIVMDLHGKVIKKFGNLLESKLASGQLKMQFVHIFEEGSQIITINADEPMVTYFNNTDYTLTKIIDIRKNPIFRSRYEAAKKKPNVGFTFLRSPILNNNKLFFAYITNKDKTTYIRNVAEFDLAKGKIIKIYKLHLKDKNRVDYLDAINIINNKLIAYDYVNKALLSYKFEE